MDVRYGTGAERIAAEAARRRSFAIISHPDAGKTTLTEHLLLLGGAIRMAGQVKARGEARRARSDWMKIEQERGISVTSAVMTFEYADRVFNLLDTPGHEDFSERIGREQLETALSPEALERLDEEVALARGACPAFDADTYRTGHLTPVYFGSALKNFGVRELLEALGRHAPPPRAQASRTR